MGASVSPVVADVAEKYRNEIEELVADSSLQDALSRLQDFARDFSPPLKREVLVLRSRHNQWRADQRAGIASAEHINNIRSAILDLATQIFEGMSTDHAAPGPGPMPVLVVDNTPPKAQPAQTGGEPGDVPTNDNETLDELRRRYFKIYRKDEDSVACQCEGITKTYQRGMFTLQPLSLTLRVGEITGVVGLNSSGKTTLLRVLMGDLKPNAGRVTYPLISRTGKGWRHIKSQIAYVPQLPEKWYGRLRHNLNFVAAAHAKRGEDVEQFINWNVARYDLQRYENATWDEISGGYKIRFELVRAMVSRPRILLLDEPLAYLDVIARQRFLKDLETIATSLEQPIPIVVTSQHLHEIEAIADQMILLDDGACKYSGSLEGVAELLHDRILEVTVRATRTNIEAALQGMGLKSIESTMDGFIVTLPKTTEVGAVLQRLSTAFGSRFAAFRDISGSARSLMGRTVQ